MQKPVIVATNMLESMINHPTPTRAEVFYIAIAARERADAVMLSGETAHGKYPLKSFKVMHTVALRTESSLPISTTPPIQALLEPYGCNVCFSCHNNGQHPRHPHHCLYKDGIYGYTFKPLSALSSNFCLHKWAQVTTISPPNKEGEDRPSGGRLCSPWPHLYVVAQARLSKELIQYSADEEEEKTGRRGGIKTEEV